MTFCLRAWRLRSAARPASAGAHTCVASALPILWPGCSSRSCAPRASTPGTTTCSPHRGRRARLGEREGAVRDDLQAGAVDLARAPGVAGLQLLPQRVVEPEVDVALPVALGRRGRHVGHRALVHLAHLPRARGARRLTASCEYGLPALHFSGFCDYCYLLYSKPHVGARPHRLTHCSKLWHQHRWHVQTHSWLSGSRSRCRTALACV